VERGNRRQRRVEPQKVKESASSLSLSIYEDRVLTHFKRPPPQSAVSTTNRKSLTNPRTSPTRAAAAAAVADLETVDKAVAEIRGGDTTTTITMETSARAEDHHQEGPQHGGRHMELRSRLRRRLRRRRQDRNRMRTSDNRHLRITLAVEEAKEKVRATIPEARAANAGRGCLPPFFFLLGFT
jgi:hypothetical protein